MLDVGCSQASSHPLHLPSKPLGLQPILQTELGKYVLRMLVDRAWADPQNPCYLRVGFCLGNPEEDLPLALRQSQALQRPCLKGTPFTHQRDDGCPSLAGPQCTISRASPTAGAGYSEKQGRPGEALRPLPFNHRLKLGGRIPEPST
jgi:hypothetical protein